MRELHFIFNMFAAGIAVIILFCSSCEDISRDNILDPKNPASRKDHILVIEAFVNTDEALPPYNFWMLNALHTLKEKYGGALVICEYHRNLENYHDPYAGRDYDILHDAYTDTKGVPDVYINGSAARIQGSSGVENSLIRLETALQEYDLLNNTSYFTIEPEITRQGAMVGMRVSIARLGSTAARNIAVKAIVKEKVDNEYHAHVVRKILQSSDIEHMGAGEVRTVSFDGFELSQTGTFSVVLLVSSTEQIEHYQAYEVMIP
jgi:hypothetical protein